VVNSSGFSVNCGRTKRGTDVLFINDVDTQVEVSLTKSGPDDFNAQLPNKGSTYAHRFETPGTFVVLSKPSSELTLFITD